MKRITAVFVIAAVFMMICAPAYAGEEVYIVKPGDSLWAIARQHNMLVSEIKELNHLSTDLLQIGDRLVLRVYQEAPNNNPGESAARSESSASGEYYTVKAGDCLWTIAQCHGMTADELRSLNELKSDALYPGDRLLVKNSAQVNPESEDAVEGEENGALYTREAAEQFSTSTPSRSGSNTAAAMILQEAAKYLGTPYKYGGSGPGGFDCSGFVKYVFGQLGLSLPRTASEQACEGVHVDKSDLKPGDLVFFICGGSNINHSGIYTGGGQFIHSSSPSSGGVIYSSLIDGYYLKTYAGARRILH